jgi:hypothetical protein
MDEQIVESESTPESTPTSQKSQEQPRNHAPKTRIQAKLRRIKLINGILDGKDIKPLAISTGLSPATAASQASQILAEPKVQASFVRIMEEEGLSDKFLAAKTHYLINAKKTLYFQKDGEVTDSREVEALETQRKTLELATKLKGHLKDRSEVDVNIGIMAMVVAAVKGENGDGV